MEISCDKLRMTFEITKQEICLIRNMFNEKQMTRITSTLNGYIYEEQVCLNYIEWVHIIRPGVFKLH